jgi:hypothetical protein
MNHFCAQFQDGTINAKGNVELSGCGAVGNGVLVLKGNPAGQVVNGVAPAGAVTNLRIEAGTYPVKFTGIIEIQGQAFEPSSYTYVSSGPFDISTAQLRFTGITPASIVPGPVLYQDVVISTNGDGGDVNLNGNTMKVKGKLTVSQNAYHWCPKATNGTFEAYGDVEMSSCGLLGDAILKIAGNPAGQLVNGLGGAVGTLRIEAGANPVTFAGDILISSLAGPASFTYANAGTINWGAATLTFSGSDRISIQPGTIEYPNVAFRAGGDAGFFNLNGSTMTVRDKVTFSIQMYHACGSVDNGVLAVKGTVENLNNPGCSNGSVTVNMIGGAVAASY